VCVRVQYAREKRHVKRCVDGATLCVCVSVCALCLCARAFSTSARPNGASLRVLLCVDPVSPPFNAALLCVLAEARRGYLCFSRCAFGRGRLCAIVCVGVVIVSPTGLTDGRAMMKYESCNDARGISRPASIPGTLTANVCVCVCL